MLCCSCAAFRKIVRLMGRFGSVCVFSFSRHLHSNIVDLWYFGQSTSIPKHSNALTRSVPVHFFIFISRFAIALWQFALNLIGLCTNLVIFDGNVNNEKCPYISRAANTLRARHSFDSTHLISQTKIASATTTQKKIVCDYLLSQLVNQLSCTFFPSSSLSLNTSPLLFHTRSLSWILR